MRRSVVLVLIMAACSKSTSSGSPGSGASSAAVTSGAGAASGSAGGGGNGSAGGGGGTTSTTSGGGGTMSGEMTFFITSSGNGAKGGDFGGLAGADMKCQTLAQAVGSKRTWHAYLSTSSAAARDRIGNGPWYNSKGAKIASSVEDLHKCNPSGDPNGGPLCAPFPYQQALDEKGVIVPPEEHDILTGSDESGGAVDATCQNWTSSSDADGGQVGHSDAADIGNVTHNVIIYIWNGAHISAGCDLAGLKKTGGVARLYCFAIN